MKFWLLIELITFAVLAYAIITQVILPALRGTKLFPWFGREGDLTRKVFAEQQRIQEGRIQRLLRRTKEKAQTTAKGTRK